VVEEPVPVEHHLLDVFLQRLFPDPLPHLLRGVALVEVADLRPEIRGERVEAARMVDPVESITNWA
jgi:hypothetical protein